VSGRPRLVHAGFSTCAHAYAISARGGARLLARTAAQGGAGAVRAVPVDDLLPALYAARGHPRGDIPPGPARLAALALARDALWQLESAGALALPPFALPLPPRPAAGAPAAVAHATVAPAALARSDVTASPALSAPVACPLAPLAPLGPELWARVVAWAAALGGASGAALWARASRGARAVARDQQRWRRLALREALPPSASQAPEEALAAEPLIDLAGPKPSTLIAPAPRSQADEPRPCRGRGSCAPGLRERRAR
jgi:hypothetical protein